MLTIKYLNDLRSLYISQNGRFPIESVLQKSVSFCLIVSHFLKIRTLTKIQLPVLTTQDK